MPKGNHFKLCFYFNLIKSCFNTLKRHIQIPKWTHKWVRQGTRWGSCVHSTSPCLACDGRQGCTGPWRSGPAACCWRPWSWCCRSGWTQLVTCSAAIWYYRRSVLYIYIYFFFNSFIICWWNRSLIKDQVWINFMLNLY